MGNNRSIEMRNAICSNDIETVKTLIDRGYNINSLYSDLGLIFVGAPLLKWTYQTDEFDAFGGRDNNFPLEYHNYMIFPKLLFGEYAIKWSALMYSACLGRTEIIEILINKGADKSLKDEAGQTAYDIALKMKRKKTIQEILLINK